MPSFGYGVVAGAPKTRGRLVSFSQKSDSGARPSGPGAASSRYPASAWSVTRSDVPSRAMRGRGAPSSQDQVLRNHSVGSTSMVASSGPWFSTTTRISTSVGVALA